MRWIKKYLLNGLWGLRSEKSPGRPPKLTKTQRRELIKLVTQGPEKCGFSGGCWRTPMLQHLIQKRFDIFYNTHYISELLGNLGFSYQKAAFVASKRDEEVRAQWLKNEWPTILKLNGEA